MRQTVNIRPKLIQRKPLKLTGFVLLVPEKTKKKCLLMHKRLRI